MNFEQLELVRKDITFNEDKQYKNKILYKIA